MKTEQEIKDIVERIINGSDLFLVDINISKDSHIDIIIDSIKGVNMEECIRLHKELNEAIDREKEDFSLTVSSAGIGCPFKVPGQYRKNIGKPVEILLTENHSKLQGALKSFDGNHIVIEYQEKKATEGKKKKETVTVEKTIALADIKQIKDLIKF